MQNKNIVIFSSGISETHGILSDIQRELEDRGYICSNWRNLFRTAKHVDKIALLPMLIKKIPTFDYAVLICEGHDLTSVVRGDKTDTFHTMRDNVLFEIGLCAMALGLERTILITDSDVRLPDDLTGTNDSLALKEIRLPKNFLTESATEHSGHVAAIGSEIHRYISEMGEHIHQVIIGASAGSACSYVANFILRLLEHIEDDIHIKVGKDKTETFRVDPKKVYVDIFIPETINTTVIKNMEAYTKSFSEAFIPTARDRNIYFRFRREGDCLHVIDCPTNAITSYDMAKVLLNMEADDTEDINAAKRFTEKELNLYEASVATLTEKASIDSFIDEHYASLTAAERRKMTDKIFDITENRLTVTRRDFSK